MKSDLNDTMYVYVIVGIFEKQLHASTCIIYYAHVLPTRTVQLHMYMYAVDVLM